MPKKSLVLGAAASLLLTGIIQARDAAEPVASSGASGGVYGKIRCPGVENVPMTADAVQALPLQIVSTLKCGESVDILSSSEGYTSNVRTADGKTGYVVSIYVARVPAPKPSPVVASRPIPPAGIVRWQAGARGSEQLVNDGVVVESLTSNGVTVQVSLQDVRSKLQANVAVVNGRGQRVQVDPGRFTLVDAWKSLAYQDPEVIASAVKRSGGMWAEASAAPAAHAAPAAFSTASAGMQNVAYKLSSHPTIAPPNSLNTVQQVQALALKPAIVQANGRVNGAVWFERGKSLQRLILRVPLDNQVFEFPFSFSPQS